MKSQIKSRMIAIKTTTTKIHLDGGNWNIKLTIPLLAFQILFLVIVQIVD